jgi:hypothetical protein
MWVKHEAGTARTLHLDRSAQTLIPADEFDSGLGNGRSP